MSPVSPVGAGGSSIGRHVVEGVDDLRRQGELLDAERALELRGRGIVEAVSRAADGLGWSPLEVALVWVRDRVGVTAPIVGARTAAQLKGALGIEELTLPPEIVDALDDVSAD